MKLTTKERKELKDAGYIYVPSLHEWLSPEEFQERLKEQDKANKLLKTVYTLSIIMTVLAIFWMASHI